MTRFEDNAKTNFCCFSFLKNNIIAKIFLIFASVSFLLRTVFLVWERNSIDFSAALLIKVYSVGIFFDLLALLYILILPFAYYSLVPAKFFNHKIHQRANWFFYFLFLFVIIFSVFSEVVFWEEFQTRFNFIAVDYLIYTTEVIGNIVESYPMGKLLGAIFIVAAIIFRLTYKKILAQKTGGFFCNLKKLLILSTVLGIAFFTIDSSKITKISDNNYANEVAANGIYQLFSAYLNNQLDYDALYATLDIKDAIAGVRSNITKQEPRSKFLNNDDISRLIPQPKTGAEKKYNIILLP